MRWGTREGKRVKNKVKSKEEVEVKKRKERGLEGLDREREKWKGGAI